MKILLIAIDTLRADHLSCYGYVRQTSPNLDMLASEGILFQTCINQTAHTMPTFTTIMTGQNPLTHDIVSTLYAHPNEPGQVIDDETPLLAQQFRQADWLTAAFDNLMQFGCVPKWFARGYDFYVNTISKKNKFVAAVLAEEINARLIPWLRMYGKEDFFLFVHYWDVHQPYNEPEPYMSLHVDGPAPAGIKTPDGRAFLPRWGWDDRLSESQRRRLAQYDGEITYCDAEIGKVIDTLKELDIYDDTCIVVTSDHGEDMEEHNAPFEHREVYEHTVHVPLIIKPAKESQLPTAKKIETLVGHIDLMPTLLDIAGLDCPASVEGVSLMPLMTSEIEPVHEHVFLHGGVIKQHGRWRSAEVGIRTQQYKYFIRGTAVLEPEHIPREIASLCAPPWRGDRNRPFTDRIDFFNNLPKEELYDLLADPCEISNITAEQPNISGELRKKLEAYIATNPERFL